MATDILYKDESYQIMGACFDVYKEMGPGFLEAVYQECLAKEFELRGIPYREQVPLNLSYKNQPLEKYYDADFLCFENILVEIKAHKTLSDSDRSQTIHYLKSTRIELGLLVNFGHHPQLEHERYLNQS